MQPSRQLYDPSEAGQADIHGMPGVASVYEGYVVESGLVRHQGEVKNLYFPSERHDLPFALAKVREADEGSALTFASVWGLMGFAPRDRPPPGGDPLSWLGTHARTIEFVLTLDDYLRKSDQAGLSAFLSQQTVSNPLGEGTPGLIVGTPRGVALAYVTEPSAETGSGLLVTDVAHFRSIRPEDGDEGIARTFIGEIINLNLQGIRRQLSVLSTRIQSGFTFDAVLHVAYWHLADAVTGGRARRCADPECRSYFRVTDERQRFCPTLTASGSVESRCGGRYRKARQRSVGA